MSNRYAPLPNNPNAAEGVSDELEAAFDESDDEDNVTELHPLNLISNSHPRHTYTAAPNPGTYDFEADYDYPPPGSPPGPSAIALPNNIGNSNGITTFTVDSSALGQRRGWFGRTISSVLPTQYAQRLGFSSQVASGAVGGGSNMDGVFANVTAKPSRPIRVQDGTLCLFIRTADIHTQILVGDDSYLVPEDSRSEGPPSYASAQADSGMVVHSYSPNTSSLIILQFPPIGRQQFTLLSPGT